MNQEKADEFVRLVREAKAVEVKGSLYLKDAATMYLLNPNTVERADWGLDEMPLYVVCHRDRVAEVRDAIKRMRMRADIDAIVTSLAAALNPEQRTSSVSQRGDMGESKSCAPVSSVAPESLE